MRRGGALLLFLAACGGEAVRAIDDPRDGRGDAGSVLRPQDAAPPRADAADRDGAAGLDAAPAPDDAGRPADSGQPGSRDASQPADAGASQPADAGVPPDGGPDPADASQVADATPSPDATFGPADASPPADGGGPGGADAGALCSSTRDCIPGAEVCGELRTLPATIETHCTLPNPSPPGGPIGAACAGPLDCTHNLCLDGITGECSVVCADDALDCPAGFACAGYTYTPGPVTIRACTRSCLRDGDCAAGGNVCTVQSSTFGSGYRLLRVCGRPSGTGLNGAPCNNGGDCRSGICLTTRRGVSCSRNRDCDADETCQGGACFSRACTTPCLAEADCLAGASAQTRLTACTASVTFTLPDMTQAQVLTCTRQ